MTEEFNYRWLEPLRQGEKLLGGKYEIVSDTDNAGGFGRIYKAHMRGPSSGDVVPVAIKEFHLRDERDGGDAGGASSLMGSSPAGSSMMGSDSRWSGECGAGCLDAMLKQFRQEAGILGRLTEQRDEHVPALYDTVWEEGGRQFYAMRFIEGLTFTEEIKRRHGAMTEEEAVGYIAQAAKVLYKAHRWGLIHCDVSPNNLMLSGGFAVVVDFGNARSYQSSLAAAAQLPEIGTPGYYGGADFLGQPCGDVFSLAATLFFLLTAEVPIVLAECDIKTREACWDSLQRDYEKALRDAGVSEATVGAITRALVPDPARCTRDMRTLLRELPVEPVFDALLNYNDHDYDSRP